MAADDDPRFEDLFGDDDNDNFGGAEQEKTGDGKEKKEKKEKKDKTDKKEKKDKKQKKDNKENAEAEGESAAPAQAGENMLTIRRPKPADKSPTKAEVAPKDSVAPTEAISPMAKDGKKEKKDKKEKKEAKKQKQGEQAASSSGAKVELGAAAGAEPEKKDKKDKKKEKKDKKRKGVEEDAQPQVEAPPPSVPPPTDIVDDVLDDAALDIDDLLQDYAEPATETERPEGVDAFDNFVDDLENQDDNNVLAEFMDGLEADDAIDDNIPRIIPPAWVDHVDPKKKKKKQRTIPQQQQLVLEAEEVPGTQELAEGLNLSGKFAEVMDSLRPQRPLQITEANASEFIEKFVEEMNRAAELDLRAFEKNPGAPGVHKMNMLSQAVAVMRKFVFGELFITFGGCRALALWLRSLPNGELPNAHLRTTLLACMLRLPISKEALQNCKDPPLGQIVANLKQNPIETIENRKVAAILVMKWVKQVLVQAPDPDSLAGDGPQATIPRKPAETAESFQAMEEESFKRIHPTIPIREGKDYQIHPPSYATATRREKYGVDSNRHKVNEVLKDFNRPNKKQWKPYEVSIAGRTLNQL